MSSYALDAATLVQLMVRQRQSGIFQASIQRLPGSNLSGQASIVLVEGRMQACKIVTMKNRVHAEGSSAQQILSKLGTLEWQWIKPPPMQVLPQRPFPAAQKTSTPSTPLRPFPPISTPTTPLPSFSPTPTSTTPLQPFSPIHNFSSVPIRTPYSFRIDLQQIPHVHQKILLLIDARRSISNIATLLPTLSTGEVYQCIYALEQAKLVVMERSY